MDVKINRCTNVWMGLLLKLWHPFMLLSQQYFGAVFVLFPDCTPHLEQTTAPSRWGSVCGDFPPLFYHPEVWPLSSPFDPPNSTLLLFLPHHMGGMFLWNKHPVMSCQNLGIIGSPLTLHSHSVFVCRSHFYCRTDGRRATVIQNSPMCNSGS